MRLIVNGEARESAAPTLAALLHELGYNGAVVATAVNGDFAPRSARENLVLRDGDKIEILAPMKGG